jgi:hypothetical protein
MEALPSHKQVLLLINSQHVSRQVILEEYTNDDGIRLHYNVSVNLYSGLDIFRRHLCIPQESPDDALWAETCELINKNICVCDGNTSISVCSGEKQYNELRH